MVESMDKQQGLDVLGLAPSATLMDARTAFRRLAKTWHPDRFAKDPLKATIAEEKMKQLNEAFHFLLPLLADTGVGENASDVSHGGAPTQCSGKRFHDFLSSLAAGLKKRCIGRRRVKFQGTGSAGPTHKSGTHCRTGATAGRTKDTAFETVFQDAVHHTQAGAKLRFHSKSSVPGRYAHYKKYFDSVSGRPRNMGRMKNRGMGPVEEISPIAPVSPVKRH